MATASKTFFATSSQYYQSEFSIVDIVTDEVKYSAPIVHDDQGTVSAFAGTAVPASLYQFVTKLVTNRFSGLARLCK
eukprot:4626918-Pyramimonas_sp.AAC.1